MANFNTQEMEIIHLGITVMATGGSGFIGIILGGWLVAWQRKVARKRQFLEKQLQDFYSPLLAIHDEITVFQNPLATGVGFSARDDDDQESDYPKVPDEDEKDIVAQQLLPAYERMLEVFRDNMWVVDDETRKFYPGLFRFVHHWRRVVKNALPENPLTAWQHSEKELQDFFNNLQQHQHRMRKRLRRT